MLTFLTAIDAVDPNLLDAAKMDGANWFQETWSVLLPAVRPCADHRFYHYGHLVVPDFQPGLVDHARGYGVVRRTCWRC